MTEMTEDEAYLAMFAFLEHWYGMTQSDDIGALLGSMSLNPDGNTFDPALSHDWRAAVVKAKSGEVDARVKLRK